MNKYLNTFKDHVEETEYLNSPVVDVPNVCYVESDKSVNVNYIALQPYIFVGYTQNQQFDYVGVHFDYYNGDGGSKQFEVNTYWLNYVTNDYIGSVDIPTDISGMFSNSYTSFPRMCEVKKFGFDLTHVTNASNAFNSQEFTNLDFLKTQTFENVTNMNNMFGSCTHLTDIRGCYNWNVEKVENFENMFYYNARIERVNLINWHNSVATSVNNMFADCYALKYVDISGFSSVNWLNSPINCINNSMFQSCWNIKTIIVGEHFFDYYTANDNSRLYELNGAYLTNLTQWVEGLGTFVQYIPDRSAVMNSEGMYELHFSDTTYNALETQGLITTLNSKGYNVYNG